MQDYVVNMLSSGEWKSMAIVGVGALIVAVTLLVSLIRGITWPALFALVFGGFFVGAPVITPLVFKTPAPVVQSSGAEKDIAALAAANQQATGDLADSLKEVKMAVDALGSAVASAGRRAALSSGADGTTGNSNAMLTDLEGFTKQIATAEDSLRELAKSLNASAAKRGAIERHLDSKSQ